jgi:hypothetical protein
MTDSAPDKRPVTSAESASATSARPPIADTPDREPLPIWFFVGLILFVYGILVLLGSAFGKPATTVLAEIKPGLWWGAFMTLFGAFFAWFGWRLHKKA